MCGASLSDEEETYSLIFSSLKHPIRRKILRLLSENPKTFTEIFEEVGVDSSTLSYHLDSLKELVKKENAKYSLSDFGHAAISLMWKVEEPERPVSPIKKSLRRIHSKPLFIFMLTILMASIAATIYFQSLNTQLYSTFLDTRYRFAEQVSSSLAGLSGMHTSAGWGPPLEFWTLRGEYSNTSVLDIGYKQIFYHAGRGHISMLELMKIDPENKGYYTTIDGLFLDFLNFTNSLNRLFGENKTEIALLLIGKLYDKLQNYPIEVGTDFLKAYIYLNRVDKRALEEACEQATWIQTRIKTIIEEAYLE
jgi:DNA-binding Lrp family transcriptional regulator